MYRPKIILWGTPQMTVDIAESLLDWANIVAIITTPDTLQGRKKVLTPSPLKVFGESHSIPVYSPQSLKTTETEELLRGLSADIWLVIAYGKIIPQAILDIMPHRVVNIHPSCLPQYRGPAPIHASLKNGDTNTAVTLMEIDTMMDHGPIIAQQTIPILPTDTYIELEKKVIEVSATLLREYLIPVIQGDIIPQAQDDTKATYVKMITKYDGLIDWNHHTGSDIVNLFRAYCIWPKVYTHLHNGKKVIFDKILTPIDNSLSLKPGYWKFDASHKCLIVGTLSGNILVTHLTVEGKPSIDAQSFTNGYTDSYFITI